MGNYVFRGSIVSHRVFNFINSELCDGPRLFARKSVNKLRINEIKNCDREKCTTVNFKSGFCQFTQHWQFLADFWAGFWPSISVMF